uniref:transketolase n=1 Tax=Pygocentrus nattereri TaxID=42514 RepID=A0AAR2JNJ2_PYGNA
MEDYHKPDQATVQALRNIAHRLRINSIRATTAAGSGHPTSCCSVAEIMSVLFFHTMKYRPDDPKNPNNDRFVLSKKQQFVDVATGSLGQGLGVACGMAYTGKYFDKASYRVFCLLGDGEMSEGAVWEAMAFASYYQLDNLVAILDINRLGQSEPAPLQHHVEKYQRRCEAFGWHAIIVDGHSIEELCKALTQPRHQPTAIIAKTIKGKGIPVAEDKMGWHAKVLPKDMAESVIRDLQSRILNSNKRLYPATPTEDAPPVSHVYMTAEQNMVSVATGCAARERNIVFASGLATFFTRAYDQLRMAAISESNINLCGSHCGLSIGEDGPAHMGLEDLAIFRALPTSTIFYPSDGVSTEKAVELAANTKGVCYIRTSRPESNIIYNSNEDFHVGQAKVVCQSKDDQVTVVGAGVALHEALAAAEQLKKERIYIRVIDPFTIKPLDAKTIMDHARSTRGRILTVEDHYYEGGLGEAVCSAVVNESGFLLQRLAVPHVPRSGKMSELLKIYGIDRESIVQAIRKMISSSANAK